MKAKSKLSKKMMIILIIVAAVIVLLAIISMITALVSDNNRLSYRLISEDLINELDANNPNPQYDYLNSYIGTYAVSDIKSTYRGGIFAKSKVVIPATYKGIPVTSIISLQSLQKAEKLEISEGVINIGNSAFAQGKFADCKIPSSVTYIGTYAFQNCKNLKKIDLPQNLITISAGLFDGCSALEDITFSTKLESVGENAFNGCSSLKSFITENGAKYLGMENNPHYVLVEKENPDITECTINANTVIISGRAFYGCANLIEISIPDSVTIMGSSAFEKCTSLSKITLGNGLTDISEKAFIDCTSITTITIPDHIKTIQDSAFANCSNLSEATLGNGLTGLYASIFSNCDKLTSVTYNGTTDGWAAVNKRESGNSAWDRRARNLVTIVCTDGSYTKGQSGWAKD